MSKEELVVLCKRMQAGDNQAFAVLYTQLYSPLYRFIYGIVWSKEMAEDVVQETFMKIASSIGKFQKGNFLSWAYSIARNELFDTFRKRRREVPLEDDYTGHSVEHDNLELLDKNSTLRHLAVVVKQLKPEEQELVVLRYWEDKNMKQIAEITGRSHVAIRKEMSRLLQKIKSKLQSTL